MRQLITTVVLASQSTVLEKIAILYELFANETLRLTTAYQLV
jgi:hypothetical protein